MAKFLKGQNKGKNNPRWNGGKTFDSHGYVKILMCGHPMADSKGYVYKHRFEMSKKLGRIIESSEVVHHKNGNKTDNRIDNLELISQFTHKSIHGKNIGKNIPRLFPRVCVVCKKKFVGSPRKLLCKNCSCRECVTCGKKFVVRNMREFDNRKYCSIKCRKSFNY